MKKFEMGMTPMVVFIFLIALGLYDLYCVVFNGVASSVSAFIVNLPFYSPIAYGVICITAGHLLFPMRSKGDSLSNTEPKRNDEHKE